MVAELYEAGNQRKSKIQAYRQIRKQIPISERTFWHYMRMNIDK
jgi:hypothetical protein